MAVIEGSDDKLRHLVYSKKYVVIKYYDKECKNCKKMDPLFEKLSNDDKYKEFFFMKISADNNPVARKVIMEYSLPFMITYKNGHLKDSTTVSTEMEMKALIDKLLESDNENVKTHKSK